MHIIFLRNIPNISQEYDVHISAGGIVIDTEMENKDYQVPNIAVFTTSTELNIEQ